MTNMINTGSTFDRNFPVEMQRQGQANLIDKPQQWYYDRTGNSKAGDEIKEKTVQEVFNSMSAEEQNAM